MTNSSSVWVVVPNWNGMEFILDCLKSLAEQTQEHAVIVVDNGSVDESVELIKQHFPETKIIRNSKNLGFAGGVNVGIKHAVRENAKYIALFNNDAVADKNWLQRLVEAMESHPKTGITTSKLLRMDGKYLDSTGQHYSVWGAPFPRGRNQKDEGQFDTQLEVFGATGGATLYRVTMLGEIGIFDERFFAYYEDDDISFRARLASWDIQYVPEARAFHHVSATASKLGSFTRYHASKNIVMTYLKNMPGWLFWGYLPLFTLWMIRLAITSTLRGGGVAYSRGLGRVFLNLPGLLRDRRAIQKARKVPVSQISRLLYKHRPPKIQILSSTYRSSS